jgi:hypothetical protein
VANTRKEDLGQSLIPPTRDAVEARRFRNSLRRNPKRTRLKWTPDHLVSSSLSAGLLHRYNVLIDHSHPQLACATEREQFGSPP